MVKQKIGKVQFMARSSGVARRLAREAREGHPVERRIYPGGFIQAGGAKLPREQRSAALAEIEQKTRGVEPVRAHDIVRKIVLKKWSEAFPAGADATNFTFGPPSVKPFHDPDAQSRARRMLLWIPTCQQFAGVLDNEEATVWVLSFSGIGISQATIAERIGKRQPMVSKLLNRSVKKLNHRYLELREADMLPVEVTAWLRVYVGDDSNAADICRAVELLRRRDRALTKGLKGKDASTGCKGLDNLVIRDA
jgi:hypothetical protein